MMIFSEQRNWHKQEVQKSDGMEDSTNVGLDYLDMTDYEQSSWLKKL